MKINKEQINKYRAQRWLDVWGLANRIYCVSVQAEHLQGNKSYPSFSLLTWQPGRSSSILGLEIYLNSVDKLLRGLRAVFTAKCLGIGVVKWSRTQKWQKVVARVRVEN